MSETELEQTQAVDAEQTETLQGTEPEAPETAAAEPTEA